MNNGEITQNGKSKIKTPGDAYTGSAETLTKSIWKGDQRLSTHNTTQRMKLSTMKKEWKNRIYSGYKRVAKKLQENTQHFLFSMQNPFANTEQHSFHPHADINTLHNLQNPIIHAKLNSASLSITSPDAWIMEFGYNSTIPNSYFTKVYLPTAMLTDYQNGDVRTAISHMFACVHFNPRDYCIFNLAALNIPNPKGHVLCINNAEATRPSATTTLTTNPLTTNHNTA